MIFLHIVLLFIALLLTPLLLVRRFSCSRQPAEVLTATGMLAITLMLMAALGLHFSRIPINALTLSVVHGALLVGAVLISIPRGKTWQKAAFNGSPEERHEGVLPAILAAGLVLMVLPYTHFTGIDTYKWQDLATSVRMEQSLPWIIHPLSLFGFTPRAYPPAHPVLLATVQMLGNLGVDTGFGVVSAFITLLGFCSATVLARRFFSPRLASFTGLLFCLSPVFIRYAHWGTGRGLFLALFPAWIATCLPGAHSPGKTARYRKAALTFCLSLLLLLTHKIALVAVPLLLASAWAARFIPVPRHKTLRVTLLLLFAALGAAIVSPALFPGTAGIAGGLLKTSLSRFAWMIPLALIGMIFSCGNDERNAAARPQSKTHDFLFIAALPAVTLAFERQMYGALYALPFVTVFAVDGLDRMTARLTPSLRRYALVGIAILSCAAAGATVIMRSQAATPPELHNAALFLEAHDPEGPFRVHAPGMARTRIQAYVSGCPRFTVAAGTDTRVRWPGAPPRQPTLRATVDTWIVRLRSLLSIENTTTHWYGNPDRHYYFIIHGDGYAPDNATLIYDRGDVSIYSGPP